MLGTDINTLKTGSYIGRFRVEKEIGRGGIGIIFQAEDELLDRKVALKFTQTKIWKAEENRRRFLREAKILSRLNHPGICRIYDVLEYEGRNVIVLELIHGETLVSKTVQQMDLDRKIDLAIEIADALAGAHSLQIIHRDIKPENIMYAPELGIKILDFGLASSKIGSLDTQEPKEELKKIVADSGTPLHSALQERITRHGALLGTVTYMSPEHATCRPLNAQSDIYSLGLVFRELFTGKLNFSKDALFHEILATISKGQLPTLLPEDFPKYGPSLIKLLSQMTEREDHFRPDAQTVKTKLIQIRKSRKRRISLIAKSLGVMFLLVLLGLSGAYLKSRSIPPDFSKNKDAKIVIFPVKNLTGNSQYDWVTNGLEILVINSLPNSIKNRIIDQKTTMTLGVNKGNDDVQKLFFEHFGAEFFIEIELKNKKDSGFLLVYNIAKNETPLWHEVIPGADPAGLAKTLANQLSFVVDPSTKRKDDKTLSTDSFTNSLFAMGLHYFYQKGPQTALPFFQVCAERDPNFLYAKAEIATCQYALGDYDHAGEIALTILDNLPENEKSWIKGRIYYLLGSIDDDRGQHEEALMHFQTARENYRIVQNLIDEAKALRAIGIIYWRKADFDTAETYFLQAMEQEKKEQNISEVALTLTNLAILEKARNHLTKAIAYTQQALNYHKETGYLYGQATALSSLGGCYTNQENFDQAISTYSQARELFEKIGDLQRIAIVSYNLASLFFETGNLVQADLANSSSIATLKEIGDRVTLFHAYELRSSILIAQEKYEEAKQSLTETLIHGESLEIPPDLSYSTLQLARFYFGENDLAKANEILNKCRSNQKNETYPFLFFLLASRYEYQTGHFKKALILLKQAEENVLPGWEKKTQERMTVFQNSKKTGNITQLENWDLNFLILVD